MRRSRPCCRSATCRRSTRWCRSARCRGSSRGFRPICSTARNANWCSSAWRSIRPSSSRRNIPTPAAPPRFCATISPISMPRLRRCSASGPRTWSSTSARTTARCCRISRTAATACSASSRPRWARSPIDRGIPTLHALLHADDRAPRSSASMAPRASSPPRTALPISRTCTRSSRASSTCSAPDGVFISESHYLIGAARDAAVRHHLSRAPALLFGRQPRPSARDARPRGVSRAADPEPRRLDPRLRGAHTARGRCSDSVRQDARRRAERRGDAQAPARLSATTSCCRSCDCMAMIRDLKEKGARICGISAPSRASTLVNYVGLDEAIIDYVCEITGSLKIGKCMPGTLHPGGRGKPAVQRPAGLRDHLLLAHRRRAGAEAAGERLSWHAGHAAAGAAGVVNAGKRTPMRGNLAGRRRRNTGMG